MIDYDTFKDAIVMFEPLSYGDFHLRSEYLYLVYNHVGMKYSQVSGFGEEQVELVIF